MLKSGLDCLVCSTAVGTPHLVEREGRAVFEIFRQPESGWQTILKLTYQVPGTNLSTLGRRAHLERQGRAVGFEVLRPARASRSVEYPQVEMLASWYKTAILKVKTGTGSPNW